MIVKSIWLRRIHKWVGLVIGLQFLMWTISGAAMALLSMEQVAGGGRAEQPARAMPRNRDAWPRIARAVGAEPIETMVMRTAGNRQLLELKTAKGVLLFDAADGSAVIIDAPAAAAVARAAYPNSALPVRVTALSQIGFAVREHRLPIWRVDFRDEGNSSYYVSGTTGALLERRNDDWRWWDFFWMLHNMDYADRTSFNHPLIIAVGVAMAWLAVTGFWLLFRTMWRHDFGAIRRLTAANRG